MIHAYTYGLCMYIYIYVTCVQICINVPRNIPQLLAQVAYIRYCWTKSGEPIYMLNLPLQVVSWSTFSPYLSVIPLPDWEGNQVIVTVLLGRRVIHGNVLPEISKGYVASPPFISFLSSHVADDQTHHLTILFWKWFLQCSTMTPRRNNTSNIFPMQSKMLWNSISGTWRFGQVMTLHCKWKTFSQWIPKQHPCQSVTRWKGLKI